MRLAWLLVLAACGRDHTLVHLIEAEAEKLPGAYIVVEHRGEIVLDRGFGFADLEHQVPVDRDTVFAIGSISKQFGAAAILQLVETGRLSLDEPLATFLPAFPRAARITIKDLLRHTSGIEDFEYTGPWPRTMAVERTDAEVVALFKDRPPLFAPNRGWSYSTSNYLLLGMIVEQITKQPFRDYLKQFVLAPAGLEHTRFCDTHELIPHRARGYDNVVGAWVPAKLSHLTQFGIGGGLCSTMHDLLAWQKALERGRVVSEASYRAMTTALPLADGTPTGYGYGLAPSIMGGHRVIWHSGGVSGFAADLLVFPDDELRIADVTNSRGQVPYWTIAKHLLEIEPPVARPISKAELATYVVKYYSAPGMAHTLVENDQLVWAFFQDHVEAGRVPLIHVGHHTFESADRFLRMRFTLEGRRVTQVEAMVSGLTTYARF